MERKSKGVRKGLNYSSVSVVYANEKTNQSASTFAGYHWLSNRPRQSKQKWET